MTSQLAVDVSVIIPTRNRAGQLRQVLQQLAAQHTSGVFTYEILVVDNGSTDETRATVERLAASYPVPLQRVSETTPGRPWALNAGLARARGRFFVVTDDDVIIPPDWLQAFWTCFRDEQPDGIAGRVLPEWTAPRPAWLTDEAVRRLGLGCVDHGDRRLHNAAGRDCRWVGGNMAIRREVVERIGAFDVRLIRGQDEEYYRRCLQAGLRLLYEPAAVLRHRVGPERMTPAYFRMWHHRAGYYRAYLMPWQLKDVVTVMPLWRYGQAFRRAATWLRLTMTGRSWWERFECELKLREDLSLWFHRLRLWPRWWLTVLTRRPYAPVSRPAGERG